MRLVDLHTHSTASDGRLAPARLVEEASALGLSHLAISDHDTVDGVPEAHAASRGLGLVDIPAVELSINLSSGGSAHLLGYFPGIPVEDLVRRDSPLGRSLERVREARDRRNPAILEKLAALGMALDESSVRALAGGEVVGRPHIARALMDAGYVPTQSDAFDRFLARGKPAYVERERLDESEALDLIKGLGGIPVLAHPGLMGRSPRDLSALVASMRGRGLTGIEAYYPRHSREVETHLVDLACRLGLFITGGTDFHGGPEEQVGLGGKPGVFEIRDMQVARFLDECAAKGAGKVGNG